MIIEIIKLSCLFLVGIIGACIAFGFIIGFIEKESNRAIQIKFGRKAVIATGIIGTTVHEFSHYIMCKVFNHKVRDVKWFTLRNTGSTELGHVTHEYNPKSIYQRVGNFFIGVAPIIIGTAILIGVYYLLLPTSFKETYELINIKGYISTVNEFNLKTFVEIFTNNMWIIVKNLFSLSNLSDIRFWIYLIIALSIGTHMSLSKADLENSLDGILLISILSLLLAIVVKLFNFDVYNVLNNLLVLNCLVISFLAFGVLISILAFLIIKVICMFK